MLNPVKRYSMVSISWKVVRQAHFLNLWLVHKTDSFYV